VDDLYLFIVGLIVTLIVASAVGMLLFAAAHEPGSESDPDVESTIGNELPPAVAAAGRESDSSAVLPSN